MSAVCCVLCTVHLHIIIIIIIIIIICCCSTAAAAPPQPLVELVCLQALFPLLSGKAITDLALNTFGKFTM